MSAPVRVASWILQLLAAAIIGQTLFFKLTGAPETIALFEVVGGEPVMRYATALMELVAVVLLLVPRTAALGGLAAVIVMTGAIGAHVTKLGISIDPVALGNPDLEPLAGPSLFVLAVVAWLSGAAVAIIRRRSLPIVGAKLFGAPAPAAQPA
ncbi:MAG: DoxX family protein [Phycisphaerales bacterium]